MSSGDASPVPSETREKKELLAVIDESLHVGLGRLANAWYFLMCMWLQGNWISTAVLLRMGVSGIFAETHFQDADQRLQQMVDLLKEESELIYEMSTILTMVSHKNSP